MGTFNRSPESGFILPITLWIIALIGLAVSVLSEWVAVSVQNAQVIRDKANAEVAFANIRNQLIFAFARRPYTERGLEVGDLLAPPEGTGFQAVLDADFASDQLITLDGAPYTLASNSRYVVKIQDGRGLVNLNVINAPFLDRLFEAVGVNESLRSRLTDTLLDYRDEDDLARLNGAEADEYRRAGLYPPTNYQLLSPWEAQRVIGWFNVPELWNLQYESPLLTTCRSSGFNPNTAPVAALSTYLSGVSVERAQLVIEARHERSFRNARELGDTAGVILVNQPFFFSFLPGRCMLIDVIDKLSKERLRFSITLLPRSRDQPWQIDYVVRIPEEYRAAVDQLDPSAIFPTPQEIATGAGSADGAPGL